MENDPIQLRQQAHALLDMLPEEKLTAVRSLLEVMVEPLSRALASAPVEEEEITPETAAALDRARASLVARSLANAPFEDEPISEEETRAVEASKAWLKNHEPIPNEEVLAEYGLTLEDFERMGRTPLEPHGTKR